MSPGMQRLIPIVLASLAILVAAAAPATASVTRTPAVFNAASVSSNWAGYAVTAPGTTYTDVKGSWVQPAATCGARTAAYSSFWVGLGGFFGGSQGLEQIGTSADCQSNGRLITYAWYELIPAPPVTVPLVVSAGDTIAAEVSVTGTTVSFSLTDTTTGATYSTQAIVASPDLTSAEWIAEAPSHCYGSILIGCSVLPLSNFGTALFSAASATGNGQAGTISNPAWTSTTIVLGGGGAAGAVPSALSADGAAFSVAWRSTASPPPSPRRRQHPRRGL